MIQLSKSYVSTSAVAQEYVIKNANLIDVKNGELVKNVSVHIKNGKIAEQLKLAEIPSGVEVFDAAGLFMLPGLIDMHVHLVWDGSPNPLTTMKQEGNYLALARGIANAQESLRQGITTLRDVGSVDDTAIDIAKIFETGIFLGPTIIAAGRIIQPTGGHVPDIGYIAESKDELIKAVRYLKMRGATVIKIASTGGAYGPEEIGPSVYPLEDLKIVVNEAHRLGLNVASHSLGKTGIENAVQAGINTLEHGANTPIEVLKKMKEQNTYLIPTLAVYKKLSESYGEIPDIYVEKSKQVVTWHKETFHHAMEIGVPIALGTDAGSPNFGPHPSVFLEMYTMKEYGMNSAGILRAATLTAAQALGREQFIGTIDVGKNADILLLQNNPLEDIRQIQSICQVIKNGVML